MRNPIFVQSHCLFLPFRAFSGTILLLTILVGSRAAAFAADSKITHSFLGVGKANRAVIIGEDGKVEWKLDMPASDGWVLPNGNVLLALYGTKGFPNGGVVEVERETKKVVFSYVGQQKKRARLCLSRRTRFLWLSLGLSRELLKWTAPERFSR